ncbi:MAG: hypothetical protein A2W25_12220 [candidate division Zixibacteria bacterium RBG_16_53_22]|nr:MAG: hypothetical protein A2W25_12220 [candidate division Zixibacteria bacterium RBG_16_53_22]
MAKTNLFKNKSEYDQEALDIAAEHVAAYLAGDSGGRVAHLQQAMNDVANDKRTVQSYGGLRAFLFGRGDRRG